MDMAEQEHPRNTSPWRPAMTSLCHMRLLSTGLKSNAACSSIIRCTEWRPSGSVRRPWEACVDDVPITPV
eukprot:1081238-Lingulodinium_polyedra.AAC.1